MSTVAPILDDCLNCRAPLTGSYCGACGQKASTPNPTFHDVLHEASHEFLHVDGKIFQSVWLLFTRPGFLTREYCSGRRAPYLTPLRLYLIFSVLYFAAAAYVPLDSLVTHDAKRGRVVGIGGVRISGELLIPPALSDEEIAERVHRAQHEWMPKLQFVMVPVWALLVMLVTRRHRRHFPEHLFFALHVHAVFLAVATIDNLLRVARRPDLVGVWALVSFAYIVWYTAVALRTMYGGTWAASARRTIALTVGYVFLSILTVGSFYALMLLRAR